MKRLKLEAVFALFGLVLCPVPVFADGDPARGEKLFARCSTCHSVTGHNKIGPALGGVVGRKAGAVEGARYSKALLQSDIVWTEENLNSFLAAPANIVRGTTMTVRIASDQDRQDIISYLKSTN